MMKILTNTGTRRFVSMLVITFSLIFSAQAAQNNWKGDKVDWFAGPAGKIKGIRFPEGKTPHIESAPVSHEFKLFSMESAAVQDSNNIINSPPIAGFVPRIAVNLTNRHSSDDFDFAAYLENHVNGNYFTNNPKKNYIIGLFDTGASTNIISYKGSVKAGIPENYLTPNFVELLGATGSVFGRVSMPLAVFMDGLSAIDPNGWLLNDSNMVGESNISVIVGEEPEPNMPDLPTVIGSPVSVYYVTGIFNDNPISVTCDGNNYTAPDIKFYNHGDSKIPNYTNEIPLNLLPVGGYDVEYSPDYDGIVDWIYQPEGPSTIGILSISLQSLFFLSSVDLYNGTHSTMEREGFMIDTGSQVTVISSIIAARLGLNPSIPDFEVEILDVTGELTIQPGFFVDKIEIIALGDWLTFTNVPVVMINVNSPEGGYLDGIIGMNLFTEFNLVLYGGGLFGQDPPSLTYKRIQPKLIGDIAPNPGDGIVNFLDYAMLADAWLATPLSSNWNPKANLAPRYDPDSIIDYFDLAELAQSWLKIASN